MHRVELKAEYSEALFFNIWTVPNAPCGVESKNIHLSDIIICMFLMHRVELKVASSGAEKQAAGRFLMHRVELKVGIFTPKVFLIISVPNAPCGVESLQL